MASKLIYFSFIQILELFLAFEVMALPATSITYRGNSNTLPPLAIDIESCICLPITRNCDITIASSFLTETTCPENQLICCSVAKKPQKVMTMTNTVGNNTAASTGNSNSTEPDSSPRIKIVVPTASTNNLISYSDSENGKEESFDKSKTNCRCKLREKCHQNHTDYSFGFHCSYDKVRCCEPNDTNTTIEQRFSDEGKDSNSNSGVGRITNIMSNTQNSNEKTKEKCIGLPGSQCPLTSLLPVQIPLMKIPADPYPRLIVEQRTSTLPPPNLPTQYYPASNSYYRHAPVGHSTPITKYYFSPNPQETNNHGHNRYLINYNGRGFSQQGRSSPPSAASAFFTNFARLLG